MVTEAEAMVAVARMAGLMKFVPSGEIERGEIARQLMLMVNWNPAVKRYGYDKAGKRYEIAYVQPSDRLEWLIRCCARVAEWPGVAELRGLFSQRFPLADAPEENPVCNIPGYSDDECLSGTDFLSVERAAQEQKYLPQPGDEPIGDDLLKQIATVAESRRIK